MSDLNISDMDLLRLYDCATSTRLGMIDKGFPKTLGMLATLGLTKASDGGHVITELGLALLKANKHRLFLSKKKPKKRRPKEWEYDEGGSDDDF